eukprot:gene651-806_t
MSNHGINYSDNVMSAMVMCLLSGLSTAIGGVFILFLKNPSLSILGHMLSFSSGVMIYISFMDLLPESIQEIGFLNANLWFFMGMIFFALVLKLLPEGDEHAHHSESHSTTNTNSKSNKDSNNSKSSNKKSDNKSVTTAPTKKNTKKDEYIKNLGIITAVGISLHNFPEGVAVYLSCLKGINVGLPLMLAIAAHNIPEGMAVAAPIYTATNSKWDAFKYCLYSGLCEPLGAIVFGLVFKEYMTPYLIQSMLAAVAGIMVFMVIKELLPGSLRYIDVTQSAISNLVGMFFIFLSIFALHDVLGHGHGGSSEAIGHGHADHHGEGMSSFSGHGHSHSHGGHGHAHAH